MIKKSKKFLGTRGYTSTREVFWCALVVTIILGVVLYKTNSFSWGSFNFFWKRLGFVMFGTGILISVMAAIMFMTIEEQEKNRRLKRENDNKEDI
ncbi:MAG: hypothetical protein COU27_02050 [Candidatus Levybacteria bacterium CG10_big_fil_rev_8_21_14_0_10_36_7]|nr:MAG: hypothetical protein COU27_02050 [Candidatus Levybacteria bacterium CG10_big_fil_rev_8_21_14_0_10_36_7]